MAVASNRKLFTKKNVGSLTWTAWDSVECDDYEVTLPVSELTARRIRQKGRRDVTIEVVAKIGGAYPWPHEEPQPLKDGDLSFTATLTREGGLHRDGCYRSIDPSTYLDVHHEECAAIHKQIAALVAPYLPEALAKVEAKLEAIHAKKKAKALSIEQRCALARAWAERLEKVYARESTIRTARFGFAEQRCRLNVWCKRDVVRIYFNWEVRYDQDGRWGPSDRGDLAGWDDRPKMLYIDYYGTLRGRGSQIVQDALAKAGIDTPKQEAA